MNKKVLYLVQAGLIAAIYFVLTFFLAPISFGIIQLRLSEALMLLCVFMPSAIPGVTVGCFLANFLSPMNLGPIDYFGGTLATFLAALVTWKLAQHFFGKAQEKLISGPAILKNPSFYLMPLPSVIFNGLIVGVYLTPLLSPAAPLTLYLSNMLIFSLCELIVVYVFGLALLYLLLPFKNNLKTI